MGFPTVGGKVELKFSTALLTGKNIDAGLLREDPHWRIQNQNDSYCPKDIM